MIVGKRLGFDGAEAGIQTRNGTAFLFGFLGQLAANALESVANRGAGRWHVLVAVIDFDRAVVVQCLSGLVHSGFR